MSLTGQQFAISAGEHRAIIVEVGAGLREYTFGGTDVTFAYGEDELPPRCCGAVLVPWPNRLRAGRYTFDGVDYQLPLTEPGRGNAIHGLGRWARWVCVRHEPSSVTLALDIVPQTGWPFEVRVEVTYAVDAERGLSVSTSARNHGARRAPFGAGFHPYLALDEHPLAKVTLQLPASQHLVTDDAQLPVGDQAVQGTTHDFRRGRRLGAVRLDDAFTGLKTFEGRGAAEMRLRHGGVRLWFDETFRYLQVFTLDVLARGQAAIAIEPMTCPADAFNTGTGLIVLEPGMAWTGAWGLQPIPRTR
jgi:aldose 1-epimerase